MLPIRSQKYIQFCSCLIVALVLGSGYSSASAQDRGDTSAVVDEDKRYDLLLRNVDIIAALDQLVDATGISLLYDSDEITSATVYCTGRSQSAEEVLRCILSAGGLDFYRLSSGTYVLVLAAERPPDRGSLAGVVVDFDTGEPLPYANVFIADANGGVATNEAGQFTLGPVIAGEYRLVASYVGYLPYSDTLIVPANGVTRQRIALKTGSVEVTPIIINGLQQQRLSASLGAGEMDAEAIWDAEAGRDVMRIASEVDGVRSGAAFADLHIQGGESGEHIVLLDGAPIFEPVSFGRLIGSFSPLAIGRVTVHKAGFEAQHGSRLSGIVAIDHDLTGSRVDRFSVLADPFSVNARATFGGTGNGKIRGLLAVRRSLWDTYRLPAIESMLRDWNSSDPLLTAIVLSPASGFGAATPHAHSSDLGFTDVHFASRIPLDVFRSISVSGYYGESRLSTRLLASEEIEGLPTDPINEPSQRFSLSQDRYRWTNTMGQVRHDWIVTARWLASAKLRFSEHRLSDAFGLVDSETLSSTGTVAEIERELESAIATLDGDDNSNRFTEGAIELRSTVSVSSNQQLDLGTDLIFTGNHFQQRSGFFRSIDLEARNWKLAGFANYEFRVSDRTRIDLGSRLTFVPTRSTVYAEPRLSIRLDDSASFLESYAVRIAAGVYNQFVNPLDLSTVGPSAIMPFTRLWIPTDATVGPAKSYHTSLELLAVPVSGWNVRLDGFAKWLPRFYSINYSELLDTSIEEPLTDQSSFIESGSGRTLGGALAVDRKTNRYEIGASYSLELNKRQYKSRIGDQRVAAPWSEPHRFTSFARVFGRSGFSLRTRAHVVAGRSWGFRQSYYDFLASHNSATAFPPYNLKNPEAHQLPTTFQLDAGIAYERRLASRGNTSSTGSSSSTILRVRFDVLNVLNRNNVSDWSLRPANSSASQIEATQFTINERSLPGIQPMLSLEITL